MNSPASSHRAAALQVCARTIPLLLEAGLSEIAEGLAKVQSLALAGADEAAFDIARRLPQHDVADFWHPLAWAQEGQQSQERKAVLAAYYAAAFRALTNWRVVQTHGAEREVIDVRPQALESAARALLAERARGLNGSDA